MAVTFHSVKCPECGASLPIEEGRNQVFCSYCGTKVLVHNDNEHIYRHIDEAGIKQAETDRLVKLRELEMAEKNNATRKILIKAWLIISIILIVIAVYLLLSSHDDWMKAFLFICYACFPVIGGGGILLFRVMPEKEAEKAAMKIGGIRFPKGLEPFDEKHFEVVRNSLQSVGFTNISCINLHDITFGILNKPGRIESITVEGEKITSGGKVYMPNVSITITYHGE